MDKQEPLKKAVALRYDVDREDAPRVVASGKGAVAEKIVAAARAAQVPVYEDAVLAEYLSRLDLGEQIPLELYKMVAELLVFIYALDKQAASTSTSRQK
ncbi:MAG: flagellar biosynthesis [Clostridia bacterium]|nr:flagellar biosynthesis [Clostridia bacterium]